MKSSNLYREAAPLATTARSFDLVGSIGSNLYREAAPLATDRLPYCWKLAYTVPISTEKPRLWPHGGTALPNTVDSRSNLYREAAPLATEGKQS